VSAEVGGGTANRKGQPATSQPVERVRTVVAPSPPASCRPRRSMHPFSILEGAWPARRLVTPIRGDGRFLAVACGKLRVRQATGDDWVAVDMAQKLHYHLAVDMGLMVAFSPLYINDDRVERMCLVPSDGCRIPPFDQQQGV